MKFFLNEVLVGQGETLEAAVRHAFLKKLPPTGDKIPSGIKTELLTTKVITIGYGFCFEVRLKVLEVP